jgi:S-adenosylmethionine:tRNA ribosyltransferase-isomerase
VIAPGSLRPADVLDDFELPTDLEATTPPEMRGIDRDEVRLMVTVGEELRHRQFTDLVDELSPGDLLVVNDSATNAAAIDLDDSRVIHFSSDLPGGLLVVEIRGPAADGSRPVPEMRPGSIELPDGACLELLAPFPVHSSTKRLWVAHLDGNHHLLLRRHGRPITYSQPSRDLPLEAYQTVFATTPGSAEMPSAGRPFSLGLVTRLVSRGVSVAPLTLHTGVSSLESGEPPYPERYRVPAHTADMVNLTHDSGGRVVAVGTTVVRSLQTVTDDTGRIHAGSGWTDLVIERETRIEGIDAMITGWHEPRSTHLDMLVAFAGRSAVARSYETALREGYLWHEFGDSHLLIGER